MQLLCQHIVRHRCSCSTQNIGGGDGGCASAALFGQALRGGAMGDAAAQPLNSVFQGSATADSGETSRVSDVTFIAILDSNSGR